MSGVYCDTVHSPYGIVTESSFLVSNFDTFKGFGLRKCLFHMNLDPALVLQDESRAG